MRKARKKPVEIEYLTFEELEKEASEQDKTIDCKEANIKGHTVMWYDKLRKYGIEYNNVFSVETLTGKVIMDKNYVLIIGVQNEIYPCKIDIFEATYEVIK